MYKTDLSLITNEVCCNNTEEIAIIFSSEDNYSPYLGVTIQSIIEHCDKNKYYSIYILDGDISYPKKQRIKSLETKNVKIYFVNITPYLAKYNEDLFYIWGHFSISTYFRFFIPFVFKTFKKVIYCDCDAVFLEDPARLYNIDLGDNLLGAVRDIEVIRQIDTNDEKELKYYREILKLKETCNYFNAGLLIMDIPKLLEMDFTNLCIKKLRDIKKPKYVDQCIINSVCKDRVKFIDYKWNVMNHIAIFHKLETLKLPGNLKNEYMKSLNEPYFLHFTGFLKPWHDPSTINADSFWKYAKMTPFYEEIIYKNTKFVLMPAKHQIIYKNFLQRIFSIQNLKTEKKIFKVITIFGIRIKFQKRNKK